MFEHVQFIRTVCSHAHSLTARTRVAQERTAQDRVRWCVKITCHSSVMSHPLQHVLFHLPHLSSSLSLSAQIHGGVADPLKSHLPHEEESHD